MMAGLTTLELISAPDFYSQLKLKTEQLTHGLAERAKAANIPFLTNEVCGMFGLFFTDQTEITTLADVHRCDVGQFQTFFHAMLQEGIYFAPSAFEAGFVSGAHGENEIAETLEAAERVFARMR